MLIGVVSDSHDNLPLCERVAAFFRERRVELVVHLGDVTQPGALRPFGGLPGVVLRGNNDVGRALDEQAREMEWQGPHEEWTATLAGIRVGATHGHMRGALARLVKTADVVLHGHTHRRRADREGHCLVVNPGALHRTATRTCALLELPARTVVFYAVDESGVSRL